MTPEPRPPDPIAQDRVSGVVLPGDSALRPYQLEGVQFLVSGDSCLLADQMGLGKTVQAARAIARVRAAKPGARCLVIAPAALQLNWQQELNRWAPELVVRRVQGGVRDREATYLLPISVLVASYEQVRADMYILGSLSPFDVVLLDEAQRIKNAASLTALACGIIPRRLAWALTGTPVENSSEDLVSIFGFLRPGLLNKGMNRPAMQESIRPFFMRRTKKQVLGELPPITVKELELELLPAQRRRYNDLWYERLTHSFKSHGDMLALITRLKQLCNRDDETGESSKFEALQLILENTTEPDDKIIIFSQYVSTLEWISERIEPFPHEVFTGALPQSERMEMLERFTSTPGPRALLISLKAGGVGLNLNSARTVVLFDRWWNPAVESQAIERAHRFGRTEPLLVYKFLVKETIEDRIQDLLRQKSHLFQRLIEEAEDATTVPRRLIELRLLLDLPPDDSAKER